jgi:protease-4
LVILFFFSTVCGLILTTRSLPSGGNTNTQGPSLGDALPGMIATGNTEKTGVAWIKIYGVISQDTSNNPFSRPTGASAIARRIHDAGEDKNVKAIVLDINSPGGTVASVQNIYSEILKAKKNKKVVALFRDVAASGGFYVAMAADKIVAEPGTITGSVGVIMQTSNLEGLFEKIGVKMEPITSGKYKDIGSAYRPMTQEEKDLLQDMVNDTYTQFFEAVKEGRPQVEESVLREYTDGRIFTGQRAFNLGFIDKLGGEETALELAGELAGIKDPKVIGGRSNDLKDFILSFGASMDSRSMAKQLQSLTTPSVAYLWVH